MVARPGSAQLVVTHDPPIIPAAPAGSGIEGALGSLNRIAGRIENLPLEEIAGNLRSASQRIDALVSDPALDQSLQRLNSSLGEIEKAAVITRENIGPIAESLRSAADSAQAAASRAEQLMGSASRQNYDLGELIKELTRAAEAVRALATYLAENPDALLKGRAK
jgi:paraquat-inducible protein B